MLDRHQKWHIVTFFRVNDSNSSWNIKDHANYYGHQLVDSLQSSWHLRNPLPERRTSNLYPLTYGVIGQSSNLSEISCCIPSVLGFLCWTDNIFFSQVSLIRRKGTPLIHFVKDQWSATLTIEGFDPLVPSEKVNPCKYCHMQEMGRGTKNDVAFMHQCSLINGFLYI